MKDVVLPIGSGVGKIDYRFDLRDEYVKFMEKCVPILSGIGMAVSIIGMIVLCFVYSNLNGLSAVMMMNGVK